ncbi:alkyl/aryl-sulfatase [Thalassobacillus devorans]|uniref:alkyl/aryl-sulfatase n=1 Tax=Thalassobacillus devorans TaxID=279813 RepID=UPI000A1CBE22|nr:alkyl sulfatase dimerization domain-containing protein [Thalassobacillus devorans]
MKFNEHNHNAHIPHDLRKDATRKTARINHETYQKINWNEVEVENKLAKAGMLVNTNLPVIHSQASVYPVWDLKRYRFLFNNYIPFTVNPKLWVQGNLNLNTGLFKFTDNIYQVRGFDLANITFVKGSTGWIVIDCLTTKETAEAAMRLVNNYFGEIPVSAVIITHSHTDHYGGILGVLEFAKEDAMIYAPQNFIHSVLQENVNAGVAMTRRGVYMYGSVLPRDEKGQVDNGIGKAVSIGNVTFTDNIFEINEDYAEHEVDGIAMEFQLALHTEAPSEMIIYIPGERSLCIAELCNATLHNFYTLRGAEVRDPVAWATSIQKAINLWGADLTSVFGVHNWPRFGNEAAIDYLEKQRDLYQYINDQTLRLINKGYTIDEVGRMVKLPEPLAGEWYNSQFYGTVNHNAKAVYQKYIGWYNGNPVNLNKLLPEESAKKYVQYMGGESRVIEKAKQDFKKGEYQWVAEVTKQVIFANPGNREAKLLCADALEQLGYVAESGPWRNVYLTGAQELRYGILPARGSIITEDVLNSLSLENVLYLLSIRIKGREAGRFDYKINFVIPDREDTVSTELKRGIFRYLHDELAEDAAVTVTMPKETLYTLVSTNEKPDPSEIKVESDVRAWNTFLSLIDSFNQNFHIMTPIQNK